MVRESQTPFQPSGRNPPCFVKLVHPVVPCHPRPKSRYSPTAMKATIAVTLIMANQYSNSPRRLTCMELSATKIAETSTTQIHCGTLGNQNEMYMPAAVTSAPIAIICATPYVARTENPAQGLRYFSAYTPNAPANGCTTAISAIT